MNIIAWLLNQLKGNIDSPKPAKIPSGAARFLIVFHKFYV